MIISNCVINLSADKRRVLAEAFRVLKPGGRFAVSDVVVRGEVPAEVRRSMELWVGCVAGALEEQEYHRASWRRRVSRRSGSSRRGSMSSRTPRRFSRAAGWTPRSGPRGGRPGHGRVRARDEAAARRREHAGRDQEWSVRCASRRHRGRSARGISLLWPLALPTAGVAEAAALLRGRERRQVRRCGGSSSTGTALLRSAAVRRAGEAAAWEGAGGPGARPGPGARASRTSICSPPPPSVTSPSSASPA